jgi:hypothetical protein
MALVLIVEDEDQVKVLAEGILQTTGTQRCPPVPLTKPSRYLRAPIGLTSSLLTLAFSRISTNLPRTMGTDILGLFPYRDCRLLPKFRCLFRGFDPCLADRSSRRCHFPFLRCGWAVLPTCSRSWLCHAWALGFIPLPVRHFTCGPVNNRNSTRLRYLLLNVRFYGRVVSHDK